MQSRFPKFSLLHITVWAISLSYAFLDWGFYKTMFFGHPDAWKLFLHGGIDAPEQYRVGVWIIVGWMHRLLHLKAYDTLTLIDLVCLALSLFVLLHVLRGLERYKTASNSTRWLATMSFLFLAGYYLAWGHWFQEPETMPSVLFVSLSVALVQCQLVQSRWMTSLSLVGLSFLQGFLRADVAVVLHAGFFLAIVLGWKRKLTQEKVWLARTSLLAALVAGCVQLYLMFEMFPNAKYGSDGVIRLSWNLHPFQWMTMLLALFPFWLLLGLVLNRSYRPDHETAMLLIASSLYLAVWGTVGLLGEVHIFLPFGMALLPATCVAWSEKFDRAL